MSRHQFSNLTRTALTDIWSQVNLHCKLQALIEKQLPKAFRGHVQVACIEGSSLVLCTDSPLWSSDLRYRTALILKSVNSCYQLDLQRCKILVRPQAFVLKAPAQKAKPRYS